MSQQLINRNADLLKLRTEGYDVEVRGALLLVKSIPYVAANREVKYDGMLVCPLDLAGDTTTKPGTHVVHWRGEYPCFSDGSALEALRHQAGDTNHGGGVVTQFGFSNKPKGGYADFYEKMNRYAEMISVQATSMDSSATAKVFRPVAKTESESVFCYADTATPRAGIAEINERLAGLKLGIIGLGGTGSSILDLVAKSPVAEIHLFDGDEFLSHNAFRSPGAASLDELQECPKKVDFFARRYATLRRGVVAHPCYIIPENVDLLEDLDFVFVSVDSGEVRRLLIEQLDRRGIPFVDVGMGLTIEGDKLSGQIRTTLSKPGSREFAAARIPTDDLEVDNAYVTNIQVAELNTLNAAFAVIQWKKHMGFYSDETCEGQHVYTIQDSETVSVSYEADKIPA